MDLYGIFMRTYLNANVLALTVCKLDDPFEGSHVTVEVDATVLGCDSTFGGDGGGFNHGETGTSLNDAAKMSQVPVGLMPAS